MTSASAKAEARAHRILVVEDDPHTVEIVRMYLVRDGHTVIVARDGAEGLRLAREERPDLIVLDLMLPEIDGLEVCRALRADAETVPIIMLTALVDEVDRVIGLDLGADDYVPKPFSPRELAARVRAVLRRTEGEHSVPRLEVITCGQISVDIGARIVTVAGEPVQLTPTEFRLLVHFMRSPGQVMTRERIIERVFGYEFEGFDRTLDTHVSNLRRKIERAPDGPRFIDTVYGVGYRFGNA